MGINYRKVSTEVRWKVKLSSSEKWAPSSLDSFIGSCMSGWLQVLPKVLIIGCCLAGRGFSRESLLLEGVGTVFPVSQGTEQLMSSFTSWGCKCGLVVVIMG